MAEIKPTPAKKPEAVQLAKIKVRSVVGLMIHPFTLQSLTDEPVVVEKDWWINNQLEAGKLIHVTA